MKICLDCGHGATSEIAEELFTRAGAEVIALNTDYNGMDINDNCGSTHPQELMEFVTITAVLRIQILLLKQF